MHARVHSARNGTCMGPLSCICSGNSLWVPGVKLPFVHAFFLLSMHAACALHAGRQGYKMLQTPLGIVRSLTGNTPAPDTIERWAVRVETRTLSRRHRGCHMNHAWTREVSWHRSAHAASYRTRRIGDQSNEPRTLPAEGPAVRAAPWRTWQAAGVQNSGCKEPA